jgi:non-ribosomal peptide synthetase component F
MVPGAILELEELPLQPNGKVDRKRLPPAEGELKRNAEYVGPRTMTEKVLVEIWSDVLGVEQPGIHDNFFDRGGHSLTTIKIASRIRKAFGIELPMRKLFEIPTVASLAEQIDSMRREHTSRLPKLEPVPRHSLLPLSYAQQRLWLTDQLESSAIAYNIPGAVRLSGRLDVDVLEEALNELVQRHESLRTTFASADGTPVQIIAPHLNLKIKMWDLQQLDEPHQRAEVQRLMIEEAHKKFDLAKGPLIQATLLRLSEEQHVFLIVMHHIISDGWSLNILIRELATIYEAFLLKQPSPLPPLPIQYADFAHWQRQWLQGETLESHLAYWKKQLGSDLPALDLPTDRPRPTLQTFCGATLHLMLDRSTTAALRRIGRRHGATPFMTLLTAFKILLRRYTEQEDIIVGANIAGRDWLDTEGLIGFFVNELVLRTDLSGNPTFAELLSRVREVTLGAYAHQHMPFDLLVSALAPERNLTRAPLFQVLIDFQDNALPALTLPGLTIKPLDIDFATAYFDLTLLATETGEGLSISLHYKTDLFEKTTVARMLENFEQLLKSIVANPDARLSELTIMLLKAERQQRVIKHKQNKAANLQNLRKSSRRPIHDYSSRAD